MAAKKMNTAGDRAQDVARSVLENPYLQRLINDADLRANIQTAYDSGRSAYGRLSNGQAPTKALLQDKKLQKDLRTATNALRDAQDALKTPTKRKRRGGIGGSLAVLVAGAGLAVGLSESLRSKILDAMFGAEEEFDYSSTTTPPTPAPEPAPAS